MATGFKLSDGRDLSDIFTAGDAGLTVGFKTSNDVDLGRQFMGGSTGVVTGFMDPSGIDLGSRFGNDPWVAQGYTPCTMLVGSHSYQDNDGRDSPTYWTVYEYGVSYGRTGVATKFGAMSDTSLIGTSFGKSRIFAHYYYRYGNQYYLYFASNGSKQTSVVINGMVFTPGTNSNNANCAAAYNYLKAHAGQNITIYLK